MKRFTTILIAAACAVFFTATVVYPADYVIESQNLKIGVRNNYPIVATYNESNAATQGAWLDVDGTNRNASGGKALRLRIVQRTGTALTGVLRGLYIRAQNGTTTAASGCIRGVEVKACAASCAGSGGATIGMLTGGYFVADAKTKVATTIRGLEVVTGAQAGGSSTTMQGVVIFNNSSGTHTTSVALDINGGTATGHGAWTYDLRLQNGETISNATDGTIALTGNSLTLNSATTTSADGGRGLSVIVTHYNTAALTGIVRGAYIKAVNGTTAASSGIIRGVEVKAAAATCANAGNTIGTLVGGYFSADAKNKTATSLRGLEVSLDGQAGGGTSTTAYGLLINNNSSAVQTTSYGISLNGGTASGHKAFTWDIQLGHGPTISAGDGSPDGSLTAPIGSIYIQHDGAVDAQLWVNEDGSTAWGYVGTT